MSTALLASSIALAALKNDRASKLEPTSTKARTGQYGSVSGAERQQPRGSSVDFLANYTRDEQPTLDALGLGETEFQRYPQLQTALKNAKIAQKR
jgi:hypothetical protein